MKRGSFFTALRLASLAIAGYTALVCNSFGSTLEENAKLAVSDNSSVAQGAIAALREAGPEGLQALFAANRETIDEHFANATTGSTEQDWQRVKTAIDTVGGQRDCMASHLYWHTDFDAAKATAEKSGKPILSLRLLGKLTDEYSCANSRFFRTTLYANEEISRKLRDRFVLHWQSVRPVPKVTIDFGDGRKLERTVTGNSIHYILDSQGRVVDALPGLYGPRAFERALDEGWLVCERAKNMDESKRNEFVQCFHAAKARQVVAQWQVDLNQVGVSLASATDGSAEKPAEAQAAAPKLAAPNPPAGAAMRVAVGKGRVEAPLVAAASSDPKLLTDKTDDAVWAKIAPLHADDARLDRASVALMRSQNPTAARAGAIAITKRAVEDPMLRLVRNFENSISIDTVKNEYLLHRQIHEWFASGDVPPTQDVNSLNARVYAQLFLTPDSDPWLGLIPADTYTALNNDGVCSQ